MISAEDRASGDACCVISVGENRSQKNNPSQRRQRSSHRVFMAPVVSHRFPFLQPPPYTEYMNNRGRETRYVTWQSRVARDIRKVWSLIRCSTSKQVPGLVNVEGSYRFPG